MNILNCKVWVMLILLSVSYDIVSGQVNTINLDDALSMAYEKFAGLERDKLLIDKYEELSKAGIPMQPAQITITGEEFGSNDQSGVHSLNIFQNFYLPKVSDSYKESYRKGAMVAEKQFLLTRQELKRQVSKSFINLLYSKDALRLSEENLEVYNDFLTVTTSQLESGETGKLPQMAAKSQLGRAQLEQKHAGESYQIALSTFNQWLQYEAIYDAEGDLGNVEEYLVDTLQSTNPHLQLITARKDFAASKVETAKANLLPQINTGLRLQTAFGNYPLFGYQIGVNVPLFRKAYNARVEAAKIEVLVQEAEFSVERQRLDRIIAELKSRFEHQREILQYLQDELAPLVNDQSNANLIAFREGEIGYLEYLNSLEYVIKVKQQYLEAQYNYQILKVELEYWLGN